MYVCTHFFSSNALHAQVINYTMPGIQQRLARARSRSRSPRRGHMHHNQSPLGHGPELADWMRDWALGKSSAAGVVRKAHSKYGGGSRDNVT